MILEASIRTFELDRVKVSLTRLGVARLHISEAEHPTRGVQGAAAFLIRVAGLKSALLFFPLV